MGCKMFKTLKLETARKIVAAGLCSLFVLASLPLGAQTGQISGDARSEARRGHYGEYKVQARDADGIVVATGDLDPSNADFELTGLAAGTFVVELLDDDGDVVCTEGPFQLSGGTSETGVGINCTEPWAWWLLAAAAAGLTAGVVAAQRTASASN